MRIIIVAFLLLSTVLGATGAAMAQTVDLAYRQRTEERIAALDRQMRDLTGQVERLQYRLNEANRRIEALEAAQAAATAEPRAMDDPAAPAPTAALTPAPTAPMQGDGDRMPKPLPAGAAQEEYDAAYGLLGQGKFASGETAFREFLQRHPDHQLAGNARYWIAETLYARQSYQAAATAFLEAWQAEPRGPKASDNLLKLGMSLQRMDKKKEACASFGKLLSDYRDAPARVTGAASRERKSLGCP